MKISPRRSFNDQFKCKLTEELDGITGMDRDHHLYDMYHHYLLIDDFTRKHLNDGIPIRVPGSTIGGIWIDESQKITRIEIGGSKIVTYPIDINEIMKKYIGETIEL